MCGYFCAINLPDLEKTKDRDLIRSRLNPRGPDWYSTLRQNNLIGSHSLLAITEGVAKAKQLHFRNDDQFVLFFNGEIYNHRRLRDDLLRDTTFAGQSDTETLAKLLSRFPFEEIVPQLKGMFAICLVDRKNRTVHLARDRFGQKPVYFWSSGKRFCSSSDSFLTAYASGVVRPNLDVYAQYLTPINRESFLGINPLSTTFFENIHALPAGYMASFCWDSGRMRTQQYFCPSDLVSETLHETLDKIPSKQLDDLFEEQLTRAILEQATPTQEIKFGSLLSGGIDSTVVFTTAHTNGLQPSAFTKYCPGIETIPNTVIPKLRAIYPAEYHQIEIRATNYFEELCDFITFAASPQQWFHGVEMSKVTQKANAEGFKVLLSGDCADELLLGYSAYLDGSLDQRSPNLDTYLQFVGVGDYGPRTGRITFDRNDLLQKKIAKFENRVSHLSPTDKAARIRSLIDIGVFLQTTVLRHSDLVGMKNSVEIRNPFLDEDLFQILIQLPIRHVLSRRKNGSEGKVILRRYAEKKIGKFLLNPKKEGTRHYALQAIQSLGISVNDLQIAQAIDLYDYPKTDKDLVRAINLEAFHRIQISGERPADVAEDFCSLQTQAIKQESVF